jgi:6-phosphogluconolactonase (cycloisomerase 2 family)
VIFTALVAVAQTSAPTTSKTPLPPPKFLYTTDYNEGKVHGYLVNRSTGYITPSGQKPQPVHNGPTRVASDKGGYRLYVINQGSEDINAYFIFRNNGYIHGVPGSPFSIGQPPTDVLVHPSGNYVYVTTRSSAQTSEVYAFAVQSNGSLKPVPGSPFSTVNSAQALAIDPQGKYLFVGSYPETGQPAKSEVDAFSINSADGTLTPVHGTPYTEPNSPYCANGAWDMAVHPSGNFLILPNMCEGIVVYGIDRSTGALRLVKGAPFAVPYPPYPDVESIAIDPAGKYFWISTQYCESGCSQTTDTWKFNTATGVPTYLESGESGCGLLTRADPSGKFVYVNGYINQSSGCTGSGSTPGIWGFVVDHDRGTLKNITGSPWASPSSDWFLTIGLAVTR